MIASPCINLCKMDPASGLCAGCYRTLEEITVWSGADDARRMQILTAVAGRRPPPAPPSDQPPETPAH